MLSLITLTLIASAVLVAVSLYWRRYRHWSARLPNTEKAGVRLPLIGHLYKMLGAKHGMLEKGLNVVKAVGVYETMELVGFWMGEVPAVVALRAEDVEVLLSSPRHIFKLELMYKPVRTFFGNGLITLSGDAWLHHRKVLTPVFHFKILEKYVEIFIRRAESLAEELLKPEFQGIEVDALPILTRLVSNTICETAFGMGDRLEEKEEIEKKEAFFAALETAFKIIVKRVLKPWLMLDALFRLSPLYTEQKKAEKTIQDYSLRIIRMKKEEIESDNKEAVQLEDDVGAKKKVAFLDLVLRDQTNLLSEEEILQEVRTLVTVQQTTASTMAFIFVMLAIYQDAQEEVFKEIEEFDRHSDDRSFYECLGDLKFLERVIKETLRLYPVTALFSRELKEDLIMPECTLPAGIGVGFCPYITHRDKRFYGPDPERFDPDHFLPERCRTRHPFAYIPFSAGPRNCIGQKYAMLQMKSVVSTIVRKFRIFPGKGCHSQEEMNVDIDTFLFIVGGFNVRFEPRDA